MLLDIKSSSEFETLAQEVLKVANKRQTLKEEVDQLQQTRVSKLKESKELVEKLESVKLDISNTLRLAEEKENEISCQVGKLKSREGQWESEKLKFLSYIKNAKEHLGLEILPTKTQSFIFSLTKVDKRNLDRKFLCEISLSTEDQEKQKYKVLRTLPEVDCLDSLVSTLNETGDLSGFIVTLRRKFEAMA